MITVTVYGTGPTCTRCRLTVEQFEDQGVVPRVVDLTSSCAAREYVAEDLGYTETPVVVVEDGAGGQEHWCGLRVDKIARVARAVRADVVVRGTHHAS